MGNYNRHHWEVADKNATIYGAVFYMKFTEILENQRIFKEF